MITHLFTLKRLLQFRNFIAAFILILTLTEVNGQILNIERMRLKKDTAKALLVKGTAGFNMFNRSAAADDPVNLIGHNVLLNAAYIPGRHSYIFIGRSDYLRINEAPFLNFGFLHGRVNFLREEKFNYEVFVQYSYDNFRGLDPRMIAGGSVRHRLITSKASDLILGIGGFYENELWEHPVDENLVRVQFLKSSNYISFRTTLSEFVDLNMVHYYQVGYDQGIEQFRHRINSNININTKITDRFSLNNAFEMSYEDKPIVPITKFIFSLNLGMSLDL